MGPNSKKMTRKQYVNKRLRILDELCIPRPPKELIELMMDESKLTEVAVDAKFLKIIKDAR